MRNAVKPSILKRPGEEKEEALTIEIWKDFNFQINSI